uniref:Uncharacterized protein n=1 Tax=Schistosoma curassoni TaxID=6186 RepID=A0A183KCX6_9TREM
MTKCINFITKKMKTTSPLHHINHELLVSVVVVADTVGLLLTAVCVVVLVVGVMGIEVLGVVDIVVAVVAAATGAAVVVVAVVVRCTGSANSGKSLGTGISGT